MTSRNARSGVAMLEMMIALIAMAMIALMIASSLGFYGRVLRAQSDRAIVLDEALARFALRRWARSIPLSVHYIGAVPETRFVGEADELRFTTFLPNGPFWAGDPIEVTLQRHDDGSIIARGEGTHLKTRDRLTRDERLGTGAELRLKYYGRQKLRDRPMWHESWDGRERLPDLVRVETDGSGFVPLVLEPGLKERQNFISRSSLLPPARPSRP